MFQLGPGGATMKQNYRIKALKYLLEIPIFNLLKNVSGTIWDKCESRLFDFNKTIVSLSSSILVLSFSLISLTKVQVDTNLIIKSWLFITMSLISGLILYYLRFITFFLDRIVEDKANNKKYTKETLLNNNEVYLYYLFLPLMFIISFAELMFFIIGIIILMLVAQKSLH